MSKVEFESAEELESVPAEQLAHMVKDPENPKAINLSHSAFKYPRECWDKILSTQSFEEVSETEQLKLLMCHPGAEHIKFMNNQQLDLTEDALPVELPTVKILERKIRVDKDGNA